MKCEDMAGLLDRWMDGELTEQERRAMEAHAETCAECAGQMRAMAQMKALFDEIEPEVAVPLDAQAKWRGAIREQAKQDRARRLYRRVGAAAAAVVVLVGAGLGLGLKNAPKLNSAGDAAVIAAQEIEMDMAAPAAGAVLEAAEEAADMDAGMLYGAVEAPAEYAVLEADGVQADAPMCAASAARVPSGTLELRVEDVEKTRILISDLVEEYEGAAEVREAAEGVNLFVELPGGNVDDFLSALSPMDADGRTLSVDDVPEKGDVALLLIIQAKE